MGELEYFICNYLNLKKRIKRECLLSAIHDLIGQISDSRLRERLLTEWATALETKKFGLVFEDHSPELIPLHGAEPRKGDLVYLKQGSINDVWKILAFY